MLHTRLVTIKRGNATTPELEPVAIDDSTLKKSCKEKVMEVVSPMLTPISQAVLKLESKLKDLEKSCKERVMEVIDPILTPIAQDVAEHALELKKLEKSKVSEDYFQEMLAVITKCFDNQQKEIDELIARQKSEDEEESAVTVACVAPAEMAFLLKFNTQKDFEKAEPCLRSLSNLLEQHDVDFELIEL